MIKKNALVITAITLLSYGCATGPVYTQPTNGQVAIIRSPSTSFLSPGLYAGTYTNTFVDAIDGKRLKWNALGDLKVTPGQHTLAVSCTKSITNFEVSGNNTITFYAEAGQIYTLHASVVKGNCVTSLVRGS